MDKIAQALRAVMTEIQAMPEPQQPGAADRKEFALLLSGIATCRKAPGIPVHMGYESLYRETRLTICCSSSWRTWA